MKIKKITALALAAFLAIGVCGCGSDKKTDSEGYVSTKSVSERIEDYKEIEKEYNKNVKGGIIDNNTPEAQAEYKKKKEELLRFSPESELVDKLEQECESIRKNDTDAFLDALNMDCYKFYLKTIMEREIDDSEIIENFSLDKIIVGEVQKEDWYDTFEIEQLDLTSCDALWSLEAIKKGNDYAVIRSKYRFKLKDCEICGYLEAYQTLEHGNSVEITQLGTSETFDLKDSNSIAKYAYTICSNYIADKMAEGNSMDDILNSGAFSKSMSSQGLDIEQTGDVGEGDRLLIDGIKNDYDIHNYTIYIQLDEKSNISFVQAKLKGDERIIGQYPDPIEDDDIGKVTFGEKY